VPLVYEAAAVPLMTRPGTAGDGLRLIHGHSDNRPAAGVAGGLPRRPDTGFYGRHETLLALDRAFDRQQVALVHGYAGAGKTTVAAEFARWYEATGGLDDPELGAGRVIFTSFDLGDRWRHARAVAAAADEMSGAVAPEDRDDHWHSGTGLLAPAVVHHGRAETVQTARAEVLAAAYAARPERFVRRPPAPPPLPAPAWINPPETVPAQPDPATQQPAR
jgi:putative transposase